MEFVEFTTPSSFTSFSVWLCGNVTGATTRQWINRYTKWTELKLRNACITAEVSFTHTARAIKHTHTDPTKHKQSRFHLPSLSFIIILLQGHQGRRVITGTVAEESVKAPHSPRNFKNFKLELSDCQGPRSFIHTPPIRLSIHPFAHFSTCHLSVIDPSDIHQRVRFLIDYQYANRSTQYSSDMVHSLMQRQSTVFHFPLR